MIIFTSFLVSASIFFTAFDAAVNQVIDSTKKSYDDEFARLHTSIRIQNATYNETRLTLTMVLANTGSVSLEADKCQVLIDGELRSQQVDWLNLSVDGGYSNVWAPQTILVLEMPQLIYPPHFGPERLKVVTGNGVSDYSADVYISP